MDKRGNIPEHSQEKLLVYEKYLEAYLSVLTNQTHYGRIFIWDIFAGRGKDDKGTKGSALVAAEIIKNFRDKKKKDIRLFLNELDENNYEQLKKYIEPHKAFTEVYQTEGENFLNKINQVFKNKNYSILNLFFIDPYGYTQYKTETLKELFNLKNSEYLIFIPTNHIYRFANALKKNNPAAKFLENLGIENKDFKNAEDFTKKLEDNFKKVAKTDFVYSYKIENKQAPSSFHHLFFITKHITGAEKFLGVKDKVKDSLAQYQQLTLFDNLDKEDEIKSYIKDWKDNHQVYEWGIKNKLLSENINPILKKLESEKKLEFQGKRRKGSFYLKSKRKKIKIKLRHE